ncbi:hypothetical protein BDE40_3311 [Litoreibacter halocynthiae]|uniref:Uncharacterized protein n=1 Tax=Litoreibacter halocynthiae TaxID=1242689 RepID=A0A4R7LDE4_9RHOB|nr:hypothetical protein [Litoreibacter halocynthiae]TDT73129.1 hypothetical protein BDE40_3311 [Litoreibacter halocynthiae]
MTKALVVVAVTIAVLSALYVWRSSSHKPLGQEAFDALYEAPAPKPPQTMNAMHLGHSLVSHDMPELLVQLSDGRYHYNSQLGWGTFLKAHWDPDTPINGFEDSNGHPQFRDAHEAIASGEYDAIILTEAVEIRDSIKYMDSAKMLHNWATKARANNPDVRVYFYETWHDLDDPEGWLERLDRDLEMYWEGAILRPALNLDDNPQPIYVIPAGQVMARFVREIEKRGGVGPIKSRTDLFSDTIHFNAYGAYLVALTHFAVLYQTSPVGLPHNLVKFDGTPAPDPGPEAAKLMQEIVWDVVTRYSRTGVPQQN